MKVLKFLGMIGSFLLAGFLVVGNCIMNIIGLLIGAITSSK